MTRRLFAITLLLLAASPAAAADWKAGAAKVNITPDQLMWMSGYASRDQPAEGTLHPLFARALVLEDPTGRRAVLVALDLVGIDRTLAADICADLAGRYGLAREAVVLASSHTHSGPVVRRNLETMFDLGTTQRGYVADYRETLRTKVAAVVGEALKRLAPAKLSWGGGRVDFAVNRRNNKEADVPTLRAADRLKGPVDHDIPVLAVHGPDGKLLTVAFGYACHATVLAGQRWSGDYPGCAAADLEQDNPGAVALFWAGCGGDQNPLPRRKVELAESYGRRLADAVGAALKGSMKPIAGRLAEAYGEIDLPFGEPPTREQFIKDTTDKNRSIANRAKHWLEVLNKGEPLPRTYPYPVQAWQLGDGPTWVALGGEVVVDYALRLKREFGPGLWVASYCNDVMAYIPSLRVLREGGYEGGGAMVYYGLPTAWGPAVEEKIVAAVHERVKAVSLPRINADERR